MKVEVAFCDACGVPIHAPVRKVYAVAVERALPRMSGRPAESSGRFMFEVSVSGQVIGEGPSPKAWEPDLCRGCLTDLLRRTAQEAESWPDPSEAS